MDPIIQNINPKMMIWSQTENGKEIRWERMTWTSNKCVGLQRKKTRLQDFIDNCLEWEKNRPPPPPPPADPPSKGDVDKFNKLMLQSGGIVQQDDVIKYLRECDASNEYIDKIMVKEDNERAKRKYEDIKIKFIADTRRRLDTENIPTESYGNILKIRETISVLEMIHYKKTHETSYSIPHDELKPIFEEYDMHPAWIERLLGDEVLCDKFINMSLDDLLTQGIIWMERETMDMKEFIEDVFKDKKITKAAAIKKKTLKQQINSLVRNTSNKTDVSSKHHIQSRKIYYNI